MPASQTDYRSTHSRSSGRVWEDRGYDGEKTFSLAKFPAMYPNRKCAKC